MIKGKVTEAEFVYQRITYVNPVGHHYESLGEKPYIKHSCPICDILGNNHQVYFGQDNCPLCNVNLNWEEEE